MSAASTIERIHCVGLSVTDLERSVDFYCGATGLTVAADPVSEGAIRRATLTGPTCQLELHQNATARRDVDLPVEGPGITHVCYQSPTVDDLHGRMLAAGATPQSWGAEPIDLGGYGVYYAYARDPDGIMFEVEHLDRPGFDGSFWVSHVALASRDLDRLAHFYATLFAKEADRRSNRIEGPRHDAVAGIDGIRVRAAWFDVGDMMVELWQFERPAPRPQPVRAGSVGYEFIAFEVGDLERESRRLVDAGVEIGPLRPGSDGTEEARTADPDGNLVILRQRPT